MIKTKTNKAISILLTLTMIFSMFLSAVPVSAVGDPQIMGLYINDSDGKAITGDVTLNISVGESDAASENVITEGFGNPNMVIPNEGDAITIAITGVPEGYETPDAITLTAGTNSSEDGIYDYVYNGAEADPVHSLTITLQSADDGLNTYTIRAMGEDGPIDDISVKLTQAADGTVVDEWTTTADDYERSFELDPATEYKLSITADIEDYYNVHNYSVTFTADGDIDAFAEQTQHLSYFYLEDNMETTEDESDRVLKYVLNKAGEGIPVDGTGELTINFRDREGNLVETTGKYFYDNDEGRSDYGFFTAETLNLTNLPDGEYTIRDDDAEVPADEGYLHDSGEVNFIIENGEFNITYDEYGNVTNPNTNSPSISNISSEGFDFGLDFYKVGFQVVVPGIDYDIPFTVVAEGEEENLVNPDNRWEYIYLAPGTYVLAAQTPEEGDEALEYIDFENNPSVKFVVGADRSVSIAEGETADAECENFGEDKDSVMLRLAPKQTKTITAAISAADGQNFNERTYVNIETADGSLLHSQIAPSGESSVEYTWTVPQHEYVENPDSDSGDYIWREIEGYNVYGVWYDDEWTEYDIIFTTTDGINYTATVDYGTTSSEPAGHTHAICGEEACETDHNLDGEADDLEPITWLPLSEAMAEYYDSESDTYAGCAENTYYDPDLYEDVTERSSYLPAGSYYLDKDITLNTALYITSEVNLCLNGHMLAMADNVNDTVIYYNGANGVQNLADCNGGNGSYKFTQGEQNWELSDSGEHTVTGGVITGGKFLSSWVGETGSAIAIYAGETTFNMYGGNIVGNNAGIYNGGGICAYDGTLNIYGGTIQGNYAGQEGGGIATSVPTVIYDVLIANNICSNGNTGGGICASGTVTMLGGEIKNNSGSGVGVDCDTEGKGFIMQGGSITGNTGGGICEAWWIEANNYITLGGDTSKTITIADNVGYNVMVHDGYTIAVNDLAEDSVIGITTESTEIPVQISTTGADYAANFTSDVDGYRVAATEDGGLQLEVKLHEHPVCGAECDGDCGVAAGEHTDITWTALTQEMVNAWTEGSESTRLFTLPEGNYYLASDIAATKGATLPDGNFNLCLNGYTWDATYSDYVNAFDKQTSNIFMNVCDCGSTGTIKATNETINIYGNDTDAATLNIYGGTMYSTSYTSVSTDGKAVTNNIYGGTIISGNGTALQTDSGNIYIYGGSFVGGDGYETTAVRASSASANIYILGGSIVNDYGYALGTYNGKYYLSGELEMRSSIADIEFGDPNQVTITGAITVDEPITVELADESADFTSNWGTYMPDAKPTDYFASTNSSKVVALNASTNELYLADKTVVVNAENGTVDVDKWLAVEGDEVILTVTPDEGYKLGTLDVRNDSTAETVACKATAVNGMYTFTMPATSRVTVTATFEKIQYSINISGSFEGGTVTAGAETAGVGDTVTLTVTPDEFYNFEALTVTNDATNEVLLSVPAASSEESVVLLAAEEAYNFTMPANSVTVNATFALGTSFTVSAVVDETDTTDRDTADEGMDVYADDYVYIDVVVNGGGFTNADWTLVYDPNLFEYVDSEINVDGAKEVTAGKNTLSGVLRAPIADGVTDNEYQDNTAVITYRFKAIAQVKDNVTGTFFITDAHVNDYEMAGDLNNYPANKKNVDVTIIHVTADEENPGAQNPAGTIEDTEKDYNGKKQAGASFILAGQFENASVTYAAKEDGSAVEDADSDGLITSADIEADTELVWSTALPSWKDRGTYTYYVKVSGDGLSTIYDSATLTINPVEVVPTVDFAVDPEVGTVVITPKLTGVLDNSASGVVVVTDKATGAELGRFNASEFKFDGEDEAVGESFEIEVLAGGDFVVNVDYEEGTDADGNVTDNYYGEQGEASVNVDKLTAPENVVNAIEAAFENVFVYNGEAQYVVVKDELISEIEDGTWSMTGEIVSAYDETKTNPSVTNVGDHELVKVVFTDSSNKYNEVTVYVALKVTPAHVVIDIADDGKMYGEADPETFDYTVTVVDETTGDEIRTGLYADDDLGIKTAREPGEDVGEYAITAGYVPDDNYAVTVNDGTFTITELVITPDNDNVLIEVVDNTGNTAAPDSLADYVAGKRLILVYTNLDKVYFSYGDDENGYDAMYDVTGAGYKYVDNIYEDNTLTANASDVTEYRHVYGILVDAIAEYEATEQHEELYRAKVKAEGNNEAYKPVKVTYDADINLTEELDVNDYSMTNGIYNVLTEYKITDPAHKDMISALKADYDKNKIVNSTDTEKVQGIVDKR